MVLILLPSSISFSYCWVLSVMYFAFCLVMEYLLLTVCCSGLCYGTGNLLTFLRMRLLGVNCFIHCFDGYPVFMESGGGGGRE